LHVLKNVKKKLRNAGAVQWLSRPDMLKLLRCQSPLIFYALVEIAMTRINQQWKLQLPPSGLVNILWPLFPKAKIINHIFQFVCSIVIWNYVLHKICVISKLFHIFFFRYFWIYHIDWIYDYLHNSHCTTRFSD
jgi:hypothetical protein